MIRRRSELADAGRIRTHLVEMLRSPVDLSSTADSLGRGRESVPDQRADRAVDSSFPTKCHARWFGTSQLGAELETRAVRSVFTLNPRSCQTGDINELAEERLSSIAAFGRQQLRRPVEALARFFANRTASGVAEPDQLAGVLLNAGNPRGLLQAGVTMMVVSTRRFSSSISQRGSSTYQPA